MSSANTPPPADVASASASPASVVAGRTRRNNKRHSGSSLANDDDAKRRMRDTIRRRYINSPQHSIYRSPTPNRRPPSNVANRHAGLPAVSLSFNAELTGEMNQQHTAGDDVVDDGLDADVDGGFNVEDDDSLVSSDGSSVGSATDAFYNELETQPPTQPTTLPELGNSGADDSAADDQPTTDIHHPSAGKDATYTPHYVDIPPECRRIINEALRVDWSIDSPREFQVQSIYRGAFFDNAYMHIDAKTGFGKSIIPLCIASLRHGVAVVQVPLIGLGSDQVAKAMFVDKNIEAYHVDEHKYSDATLLKTRLKAMTPEQRKRTTIVLYLSPQCLAEDSEWTALLKELATKDYISLLAVDEAHYVNLHGSSFRPEFIQSIKTIRELHRLCPTVKKPPRIIMSATLREIDRLLIDKLLDAAPDFLIWTDMNRRRIYFDFVVSGSPTQTCSSALKLDLDNNPEIKVIWYTNSKMKAEDSMVPSAENKMDKLGIDGEAMACTGDCGIMEKSFLIAAFRGDEDLFSRPEREELADATIDDEMCDLPNLKVLCATEAANCGISSKLCRRGYRNEPPANMYTLVQEMGRMDRDGALPAGENRYEIHISFPSFVSMYVRCKTQKDKDERDRQLVAAHEVLQFLVTPAECYHRYMERYFEHDTTGEGKEKCVQYCSFCRGSHKELTGVFRKKELIQKLSVFLNAKAPKFSEFTAYIRRVKDDIFEPGQVADSDAAPIHALCLQLLAKGIVELDIREDAQKLIGTDKLRHNMVTVKLGTNCNGFAINDDECWTGLTFVPEATKPPQTQTQTQTQSA